MKMIKPLIFKSGEPLKMGLGHTSQGRPASYLLFSNFRGKEVQIP
jgi:hypothetical protein